MAKTPVQIRDIDSRLELDGSGIVKLSKIDAPYTTVVKRAQVTDFSKDLMPRMGVERIIVQLAQEVADETGPAGERVFKPINDIHDQIRFVGSWFHLNDGDGAKMQAALSTDYVEITFYGTGLNILCYLGTADRGFAVTVDGQAAGNASILGAAIMAGRKYSPNIPINAVSGLPLGLHTVKLTSLLGGGNGSLAYGFEILNESTSVKTATGSAYLGGKRVTLAALDSQPYNSGFESGTLGTKGGRVIAYLDSDGSIKKALTPTEATQLNLASANHANEELIRSYHWREFGCGRADDFSTLVDVSSSRAFTLDDGTTTLHGNQVDAVLSTNTLRMPSATTRFITLTFVGTGIDIVQQDSSAAAITVSVTVDNVAIGSLPAASTAKRTVKIASGLSYGTHTLRLDMASGGTFGMHAFNVYGPKKPAIPAGAVELADYYLMGDHTSLSGEGVLSVSSGTLRKQPTRETVYVGSGWSISAVDTLSPLAGFAISTTGGANVGNYCEFTFVGTGIDFRTNSEGAATYTITIDGSTNFTVANGVYWSGALTTSNSGGALSFTPSTGVFSGNTGVARITLEGMNYRKHTIRITLTSSTGGGLYPEAFDVITPIHSPKSSLPGTLQNVKSIGSNSIGDSRIFAETQDSDIPNWGYATGVSTDPTVAVNSFVPMTDMLVSIKTSGKPVEINFCVDVLSSAAAPVVFQLYLDGVAVGVEHYIDASASADVASISNSIITPASAGFHVVQLMWRTTSGTATGANRQRNLSVKEL